MILNQDLSLEDLSALTRNASEAVLDDIKRTRLTMSRGKIYFQAKVIQNFGGEELLEISILMETSMS